jgi:hypothetical protein
VTGAGPGARFGFVQFEFAFPLGPADGRYMVRDAPGADPERIVVLRTGGARPRPLLGGRRPRRLEPSEEPEPVPVVTATIVRPAPFDSAGEADAWLDGLRGDRDALEAAAEAAASELNAVLRAHRAAAADPYARDVAPAGANAVRAGYGSGQQVAEGRFAAAIDVPPPGRRSASRRRAEALAPHERLASILSGHEDVLACEELVLRARADLAAGRPREAALQARVALEALLAELRANSTGLDGLEADREPVGRAANAAIAGDPGEELNEAVVGAVARMEHALRRRRHPA